MTTQITAIELAEKILDWEAEAQECFTDYYMHDIINWREWAAWLFNKGHEGRALQIRYQLEVEKNTCVCQDLLFRVNGCTAAHKEDYAPEVVQWSDDEEEWLRLYKLDVQLWAQYHIDDPERLKYLLRWFEVYPETWLV